MNGLYTKIELPEAEFKLNIEDGIVCLGSCFADRIGDHLNQNGFNTLNNPFGIIYNPISLSRNLISSYKRLGPDALTMFESHDIWHSFNHHSDLSSDTKEGLEENIENALNTCETSLKKAKLLIVTFGSAFGYHHNKLSTLVANCHKVPNNQFRKELFSVDLITSFWEGIVEALHQINPSLHIQFTVSPVRHKRDGFHNNQLSKSTLLLAVNKLMKYEHCSYFPSYEIVLDQLRDYRFYEKDLLHPNELAMDEIWKLWNQNYIENDSREICSLILKIRKAENHRIRFPHSERARAHQAKLQEMKEELNDLIQKRETKSPSSLNDT